MIQALIILFVGAEFLILAVWGARSQLLGRPRTQTRSGL